MNRKRERELWRELDRLTFWSSAIVIGLLVGAYFLIASLLNTIPIVRDFLLAIITNLIPVFLLFALSYAFLRRVQSIRSEADTENLIESISARIKTDLQNDLVNSQLSISSEIKKIETEIAKLGDIVQENFQTRKIKILFISANPLDTARLRIVDEVHKIKEGLRNSKFSNYFIFEQEWGVRKDNFQTCLLHYQPDILHFSGHSDNKFIVFEDSNGKTDLYSLEELQKSLAVFRNNLQLVFLNGVRTSDICEVISNDIDYTVGAIDTVDDQSAIDFAAAFYNAIGNNIEIEVAFDLACARVTKSRSQYVLSKPKKGNLRKLIPDK